MKRLYPSFCMALLLSLHAAPSFSQNKDFAKAYQEMRQSMLDNYQKFRNTALTNYDEYLQHAWKEFKRFKGDPCPNLVPKPKEAPTCTNYMLPEVVVFAEPKPPVSPIVPRPTIDPVKKPKWLDEKPEVKPDIPDIEYTGSGIEIPLMPPVEPIPVMPAMPHVAFVHVPLTKERVNVDFYGEEISLQKSTQIATHAIASTNDVASYWSQLKKSDLKELTQAFATESRRMGLSDWGSAMLVEKYIDQVMPDASKNEKVVAMQYVLANCGYNVRLAMNSTQVALLIPYAEHVFEKTFIYIDGKRYYVYPDVEDDGHFYTCELPKDAELGKDMELRFNGKTAIGDDTKPFDIEYAGIHVNGEISTGVMQLLNEYPVIDIPTVASCVVDKDLRAQVVEQIREQVQGLDEQDAANRILRFIQKGFQYATDDEQFKREKYFYFEETLFYPQCDCEDRAIFYAYLVHEILGLDVHLIQFPGHECTAVAFHEPVENGTSYEYKGKRFYICDPTYIGARIGRCMPSFAKESPQIEVWY